MGPRDAEERDAGTEKVRSCPGTDDGVESRDCQALMIQLNLVIARH